jgi:hypothetical protein
MMPLPWNVASSVNSHLFIKFVSITIRSDLMLANVERAWWRLNTPHAIRVRSAEHRVRHVSGLLDIAAAATASVSGRRLRPPTCGLVMDLVSSNVR